MSKPRGYWTVGHCQEEALKYNTRNDFKHGHASAYATAHRNDWMDDICGHMDIVGSKNRRTVYAVMFKTSKSVYVGLSYNPMGDRLPKHLEDSSNPGLAYELSVEDCDIMVLNEWFTEAEIGLVEQEIIDWYDDDGWEILNTFKAGGLGSATRKWTLIQCGKEALEYNTRTEFCHGSPGAYDAAYKHGWLDDICHHMIAFSKPHNHWNNKDRCGKEALEYNTRTAFRIGSCGAYNSARLNGWLDDICSHMPKHWLNKTVQ